VARRGKAEAIEPSEKIARVLAIGVTKGLDAEEAARRLLAAGFDSPTIGGLLDKNPNFANVAKGRAPKKAKD
jgi:hypothetical protein